MGPVSTLSDMIINTVRITVRWVLVVVMDLGKFILDYNAFGYIEFDRWCCEMFSQ